MSRARSPLQVEYRHTDALLPSAWAELLALCDAAYDEPTAPFFEDVGPGVHALGRVGGTLVSHALYVERALQVADHPPLRTAYVELVATAPAVQGRGHASALLRDLATRLDDFDLAALSPSDEGFYARLGWERWRGPLSVRTGAGLEASPSDEEVMVLRLPRTPAFVDRSAPLSVEWRPGDVW